MSIPLAIIRRRHPVCRPPAHAGKVLRLGFNAQWLPDNGKPGLAFVQVIPPKQLGRLSPTIYIADCTCKHYGLCIAAHVLDEAAGFYGGASVERIKPIPKKKQ